MSQISSTGHIPRTAIIAAAIIMAMTFGAALLARVADIGASHMPASAITQSRALIFSDRHDGAILITMAGSGAVVDTLEPGTGGFIRGVMRGLARDRRARNVGPDAPFLLARRADGALTLLDPATGGHTDLDAFGPTNAYAFARLLKIDTAHLQETKP